jgi:hypothetical protein
MNLEEFSKKIEEIKTRPIPGKHVYVWNDEKNSLLQLTKAGLTKQFDLALEIEVDENRENERIVRREIEKALENKLSQLYSEVQNEGEQQILVVLSANLLARYRMGLTVFYSYYIGDRTMVVFVVPKPEDLKSLNFPEYIEYDPNETLKYLINLVGSENVVGGK